MHLSTETLGIQGETNTRQILNSLTVCGKYKVFNNILVKSEATSVQIDHIIVSIQK